MLVISKLFLARCELVKSNNPHPFDPSVFELGPNVTRHLRGVLASVSRGLDWRLPLPS